MVRMGLCKTTNIFGHWTSGSRESSMTMLGLVRGLAWCVSGVRNVTEDFGAEISRVVLQVRG